MATDIVDLKQQYVEIAILPRFGAPCSFWAQRKRNIYCHCKSQVLGANYKQNSLRHDDKVPRMLFQARKVAGSATYE